MTTLTFMRTTSFAVLAAVTMGCGEEGSPVQTVTSALSGLQNFAFADVAGQVWLDEGGALVNSGLQSVPESGDLPSFIMVGGTMFVGYHGQNNNWTHNHYWFDQIGMPPIDSGGEMQEFTTPSIAALTNGQVAFAFHGANGRLWIGLNGPFSGQDTGGAMWDSTSPVIAGLSNGQLAVAFHGANRNLWIGLAGPKSGKDTRGTMADYTNPSIVAVPNNQVAYAFQGLNGHLWFGQGDGFGGFDTGMQMKAGTSPSVTIDITTGRPQVLFTFTSGHVGKWSCDANGNCGGVDLGGSPVRSAAWVYSDNGSWEYFYCGTNSDLWIGSSSLGNVDQGKTCWWWY